jgi:hypothetical protein
VTPHRAAYALALALALGCASEVTWHQAGATEADLERDRAECGQEAGAMADPTARPGSLGQERARQDYRSCMEARGWTLEKE